MADGDGIPKKPKRSPGAEYDVGYGKPPKRSRFKKGQSGNPSGRRTKSQNLGAMLGKVLFDEVQLPDGSAASRIDLVVKRLMKKAMEGDMGAIRQVLRLGEALSPLKAMLELEDLDTQAQRQALVAKLTETLEHIAAQKKRDAPRMRYDEHGKPRSSEPPDGADGKGNH